MATKTPPQQQTLTPVAGTTPPQEDPSKPRDREKFLDKILAETCTTVDHLAHDYTDELRTCNGALQRALTTARAVEILDNLLDETVMAAIMRLYGRPYGFMADKPNWKDKTSYTVKEVKQVIIHGLLAGVFPSNNEMNIIAGRLYITKEGYRRLCEEIPGLTDLDVVPGTPQAKDGRVLVRVGGSWLLHGIRGTLRGADRKEGIVFCIPVRREASEGPDFHQGKALRRAYKHIYERLTGTSITQDDEGEVTIDDSETPARSASLVLPRHALRVQTLSRQLDPPEVSAVLEQFGVDDPTQMSEQQAEDIIQELTRRIDLVGANPGANGQQEGE